MENKDKSVVRDKKEGTKGMEILEPLMALEADVRSSCHIESSVGFEILRFSGLASLGIESLMTSCTTFDQSLAIVNNSSRGTYLKQIAGISKIQFVEFLSQKNQIPSVRQMERFLAQNSKLPFLILPLMSTNGLEKQLLQLADILETYHIGFLIDYYGKLEDLNLRMTKYNIMALSVSPSDLRFGMIPSSVILAQRRFLVKCEGKSNSVTLDLYAHWQRNLWEQKSLVV